MGWHTTDCYGISELNPGPQRMREILQQIVDGPDDAEHPDAWLTHGPTGWTLTYGANRILTLENADNEELPGRFMRKVPPARALELWNALAEDRVSAVLALPWEKLRY